MLALLRARLATVYLVQHADVINIFHPTTGPGGPVVKSYSRKRSNQPAKSFSRAETNNNKQATARTAATLDQAPAPTGVDCRFQKLDAKSRKA